MDIWELDAATPGGVYLCQVSETVSCGACCGLYNVSDCSRDAMAEMLLRRTTEFETVEREIDAILAFKEAVEARENQRRPYPKFHHCPFIGLMGKNRSTAGCLLHPMADNNSGVDFRGLSYYGTMACRTYFCPACREVPKRFKKIARAAISDWYLFGLVITDSDLLIAWFSLLEHRLGRNLDDPNILRNKPFLLAVENFFAERLAWPFSPKNPVPLANYFFEDQLYQRPTVEYGGISEKPPKFLDILFRRTVSEFRSPKELEKATALVEKHVKEAIIKHEEAP